MTTDEINKLLATEVMGWKKKQPALKAYYVDETDDYQMPYIDWDPCKHISLTFLVVDKLREDGWELALDETAGFNSCDFQATFYKQLDPGFTSGASNFSLAICKAALTVKEIKIDE